MMFRNIRRLICRCIGHRQFMNWRNGMQKDNSRSATTKYGVQADAIFLLTEQRVECRCCDWVSESGWREWGKFKARGGTDIPREVEQFERGEVVWTYYLRRPA